MFLLLSEFSCWCLYFVVYNSCAGGRESEQLGILFPALLMMMFDLSTVVSVPIFYPKISHCSCMHIFIISQMIVEHKWKGSNRAAFERITPVFKKHSCNEVCPSFLLMNNETKVNHCCDGSCLSRLHCWWADCLQKVFNFGMETAADSTYCEVVPDPKHLFQLLRRLLEYRCECCRTFSFESSPALSSTASVGRCTICFLWAVFSVTWHELGKCFLGGIHQVSSTNWYPSAADDFWLQVKWDASDRPAMAWSWNALFHWSPKPRTTVM